jgi:hypothetical protein
MVTRTSIAPGTRIVVRDEEWLVRRVDSSSDGGRLLTCDGVSDLMRRQSSLFLTALEGPIEVLDPAETQLNQSARDSYTHAATLTRSAAAIRSTAAVTAGAS